MPEKRWTGRGVGFALAAFLSVTFAFNGIMVYQALSTFNGVETPDAYRKGRSYNHVLEAARAQAALGWIPVIAVTTRTAGEGLSAQVKLHVTAADGRPLALQRVEGLFWRPTDKDLDRPILWSPEGTGETHFIGSADVPAAGQWELRVTVISADGTTYQTKKDVILNGQSG